MATFDELLSALSPNDYIRGQEFERICKWYLENSPIYRSQFDRVWLFREWPERWRDQDKGVDLIARDRQGRLHAIQAKAYSPAYSVSKADIDTFLSESSRPQISFRMLIATTDRLGSNARETMAGQDKPVVHHLLSDLRQAELDWPATPADLQPRRHAPKQPRPHQRLAVDNVVRGLQIANRGRLVMACGTGKTLVSLFVAEEMSARRVLVLVPSLSLLAQTIAEWTANASGTVEFLPVCSDQSVVEHDAPIASTADLGFPVTTDPNEIATFLGGVEQGNAMRVVFATYQSSPRVAEAMAIQNLVEFDLAIADEAHRCAGRVSSDFGTILDDDAIRARRRVFMTATPRYFTGRVVREAGEADLEIASMDNEDRFGAVLHRFSFAEAMKQGLLTDYRVAIIVVDDEMVREWAETGRFVTTDGHEVTDARTLASQIGVAKAIRMFDLRRTISFHSRVAAARRFSTDLPRVIRWMPASERPTGQISCDYISGTMSTGERSVRLDRLRDLDSDRALLANARCLTEGIDVPALDAIAFIDPRRSEVDIVQAVGRAIRLSADKKIGTIVLPVFVSTADDDEAALEDSAFKPVWDVLKALRAHDEELAEQLDELRRQLGRRPDDGITLPAKIHVVLPVRVGSEFARSLDVRLVEGTTGAWEFWFGLIDTYVRREGHAQVPVGHIEAGIRLGAWVANQRQQRERMDPTRIRRLEALPGWSWAMLADRWEDRFKRLQRFADREGHSRVPADRVEDGVRLGAWVANQRTDRDQMDDARRRRLEAVQGWTWDALTDRWEESFARLLDFTQREGHVRVPRFHVEGGVQLGNWIKAQRIRVEQLDEERRARLEALPGWTWDPVADQWESTFALLCRYVERVGRARAPKRHVEDGANLGTWIGTQRATRDQIDPSRRRRLEALPGWTWDQLADEWEEAFELLGAFIEREGHSNVPSSYSQDGVNLGIWVKNVRSSKKTIEPDRKRRLDTLPAWTWNLTVDQWETRFAALSAFAEREGHARMPTNHVEAGIRLGGWISSQRKLEKVLAPGRRQRLESLPGWTWDLIADRWEETFDLLRAFVEREGHARVPASHIESTVKLGHWVAHQPRDREQMAPDRKARLEGLRGWAWNTHVDRWDDMYSVLRSFSQREGHSRVPSRHVEQGRELGTWVLRQRKNHPNLASDRRHRLESLPGWTWDPFVQRWDGYFDCLREYVEREGHAVVPAPYEHDGVRLGQWVASQRQNRDRINADRRSRLETLPGWTWAVQVDEWGKKFALLERYVAREGDARVPVVHIEEGFRLGSWAAVQRHQADTLPSDRRVRLEVLPGWTWDPTADRWEATFAVLRGYVEREGHAAVPSSQVEEGVRLGSWVTSQRTNEAGLEPSRRARLASLPGWTWDPLDNQWEKMFDLLRVYAHREGHSRVPVSHVEAGSNLGTWAATQRNKPERLTPYRRDRLDALPGWTWDPLVQRWEDRFELLCRFADREGHARVPQRYVERGVNLGTWVGRQRKDRDQLDSDRRDRLEALPGWSWDAFTDRWQERFNALACYVQREGNALVPERHVEGGFKLGAWVARQRKVRESMDPARRSQLEQLPRWVWNVVGN